MLNFSDSSALRIYDLNACFVLGAPLQISMAFKSWQHYCMAL